MKQWTQIFKALANINRLAIIKFLSDGQERHVTTLAAHIHVTMPSTSRHLRMLSNLYILNETGKDGHVFYSLNSKMPADIQKIVKIFLA
jgi:DNA-binding transcriptional ArsR family regulator